MHPERGKETEKTVKMTKIRALCVRDKEATLLDETGKHGAVNRQWISYRRGMYLIEGLPLVSTEHVPTMLGLSAKQAESLHIGEEPMPEGYYLGGFEDRHELVTEAPVSIMLHGRETLIMRHSGGVLLLEADLLGPVMSSTMLLQLRYTEQGTPYISAYDGFFIQGILLPFPPNKMLEADVEAVKALVEAADEE